MGESVCAAVKLKPDAECSAQEIKDYLQDKLASYKIPGEIVFLQEFPVTASGKIQKMKLKTEVLEKNERIVVLARHNDHIGGCHVSK